MAGRGKRRRWWFVVHSWVGLKLSLLMSFILVTGTLAVIANELDWLIHPSMRVEASSASERASWGEIYVSLRGSYPQWRISYIREPIAPWFAASAFGHTPGGQTRLIDINPYTAEVAGDRHWLSFQRFFRNTHRHLMLPTRIGVPIVSALSLLLIVSLVTGLVVYKKFWRGFFSLPRRGRTTRIFQGDLHRLLAVWTLWFLPVIALTGLYYLAESLGWRAEPFSPEVRAMPREVELGRETVDALAQRAREELPGLRIAQLLPPAAPGEPLVFRGYTDETWLVRPRASFVALDPATGAVLSSHRSRNANWHQRLSEMADPLHFGYFGGLTTKLIWFLFGSALSALSITGIVIYAARARKTLHPDHAWPRNGIEAASRGMGPWKWAGVAAIVIVIILTPMEARSSGACDQNVLIARDRAGLTNSGG